jgi:hypothetical protein
MQNSYRTADIINDAVTGKRMFQFLTGSKPSVMNLLLNLMDDLKHKYSIQNKKIYNLVLSMEVGWERLK